VVIADNASGTSLTVYYQVDEANSTATMGSDYQPLSGSVVLTPDLLWRAVIDVDPIDDAVAEGDERIVIRLKEDPNYVPHIWATTLTVILADEEQPPPAPRT